MIHYIKSAEFERRPYTVFGIVYLYKFARIPPKVTQNMEFGRISLAFT